MTNSEIKYFKTIDKFANKNQPNKRFILAPFSTIYADFCKPKWPAVLTIKLMLTTAISRFEWDIWSPVQKSESKIFQFEWPHDKNSCLQCCIYVTTNQYVSDIIVWSAPFTYIHIDTLVCKHFFRYDFFINSVCKLMVP